MAGVLYMLPNRIADGAAELTLPAATLAAARSCKYFLAENAKSVRAFLKTAGHPLPISTLTVLEIGHQPDSHQYAQWLAPILAGENGAVVSEAGCPGVADPGAGFVAYAKEKGVRVVPLVGPCSILLALMASGLDGQHFRFHGYLPVDESELKTKLAWLEHESQAPETELFIETPYRNNRMVGLLGQFLHPDTRVTIATDVTGPEESIRTVRAKECAALAGTLPKLPTVFALLAAPSATKRTEHRHGAPTPAQKRAHPRSAARPPRR